LHDLLWSAKVLLEAPELIEQLHYDYFRAGADVATTASYQATLEGFRRRGLAPAQAVQLFQRSVDLACAARARFWADEGNRQGRLYPRVAASIGPYGAFLADGSEYRGEYGLTVAELVAFHRPRMATLAASGADLLACETIPCIAEAEALVRLLAAFPDAQAWLSYSCRDDQSISSGEAFADAVAVANRSGQIVAVGLNCTAPQYASALLERAAQTTDKPLVAYPNRGERWDATTHTWGAGRDDVDFGALARTWRAVGARLIGGCCRTTPEDIRAMRTALLPPEQA
jgi:homocysteine S-methyltransferase